MSIENDTLKTKIELKKFSQEEMNCKWEKIQLCLNKIPSRSYYTDPRADYPLLEELEIPEEDKEVLKQCLIKLQFSLTYGYQNLWTLYREYLDHKWSEYPNVDPWSSDASRGFLERAMARDEHMRLEDEERRCYDCGCHDSYCRCY